MKQKAIIRLIIAVIATLNAILTASGANPIPFDETAVTEWLTYLFNAAMLVWTWWKDAPVTAAGVKAHGIMKAIKEDGAEIIDDLLEGDDEDDI